MRVRRRFTLDLTDATFDCVFEAIRTQFPETPVRDALAELLLRGAGVEPWDAAVVAARRFAFAVSRAEASALLADLGRKLTERSRQSIAQGLADAQMELNEAAAAARGR